MLPVWRGQETLLDCATLSFTWFLIKMFQAAEVIQNNTICTCRLMLAHYVNMKLQPAAC